MNGIMKIETAVTMTSLELVEFINGVRDIGGAELRHDSFMVKVPKVLGEEGLHKFLDTYTHPQNSQNYSIYKFPKREACLMAMSYSYDIQAKVFDRMTALEAKNDPKPMSVLEMVIASAQAQIATNTRLAVLENKILAIESSAEASAGATQSFTALGYSLFHKLKLGNKALNKLGRDASRISRENGWAIERASDGRLGFVGFYIVDALDIAILGQALP